MLTEVHSNHGIARVMLSPNQSLSTHSLGRLVTLLSGLWLVFIGAFLFLEIWVVSLFLGFEIGLFVVLLIYVERRSRRREMLVFRDLSLDTAIRGRASWNMRRFSRKGMCFHLQRDVSGCPRGLLISGDSGLLLVGAFLNSADIESLCTRIESEGLRVQELEREYTLEC